MRFSRFALHTSGSIIALFCFLPTLASVSIAEDVLPETTVEVSKLEIQDERITIRRFIISNGGRFTFEELQQQVRGFVGRNKTKADLESARDALERFFHNQGYRGAVVKLTEYSKITRNALLDVDLKQPVVRVDLAKTGSGRPVKLVDAGTGDLKAGTRENVKTGTGNSDPNGPKGLGTGKGLEAGVGTVKAEDGDLLPEETETRSVNKDEGFTIKGFIIEGTDVFTQEEMLQQVKSFVGRGKSAADIEGARDALENFFRNQGYPALLVNIPAQSSTNKVFKLDIIENRIGKVFLTGNNWFSAKKIMRELPSIAPGKVLRLTDLQSEVNAANRHPDFKVMPEMLPGKAPESVDISLKVQDQLPLHGSLEISNRASQDTTELRLSGSLRYDNLWQRNHSISAQYMMTPQEPDEVKVFSSSYTMPVYWSNEDKITIYGVVSNSNTNSAIGYSSLGKGSIIGTRLIMPLKGKTDFFHTALLGFDYKDFSETVGLIGTNGEKTPIRYAPVMSGYNAYLTDESGLTSFNINFSYIFRGMMSSPYEFQDKRYKSRGNSISVTMGLERNQKLPYGLALLAKVDGLVSDQPLISNEQYSAGGMDSVRGYKDSSASGDNALHMVLELSAPEFLKERSKGRFTVTPYIFYDYAQLWTKDPLPGQTSQYVLQGTGIGFKGTLLKNLDYQTDLGFALRDSNRIEVGDHQLHFKVRYQF